MAGPWGGGASSMLQHDNIVPKTSISKGPTYQGCHADDNGRADGRTNGRSNDGRKVVRDLDAL